VIDPLAEQLAASVLQNQQLQATIDELNAKSQAQDEQIANEKQQVTDLQAQLTDVQQAAAKPIEPESVTPAPIAVAGPGADWLLIFGLLTLLALIVLGWFVRHRRRQVQIPPEPSTNQERVLSRPMESLVPTAALNPPPALGDAHDVQELSLPNAGVGVQQLQDARAHDPKLNPIAVAAAQPRSASSDEFQLNLDDLSMDSNWELTNPFEAPAAAAVGSSELSLPEPEIEWEIEPASRESIGLMQGKR
jgi:pilus assembly protein FimV